MPDQSKIPEIAVAVSLHWQDYELLDSGNRQKLERFSAFTFVRPEPTAIWRPVYASSDWDKADAVFRLTGGEVGGEWQFNRSIPNSWEMGYRSLRFQAQIANSRHLGVFPEQSSHWDWIHNQISLAMLKQAPDQPIRVLNLFGYTGLASLAAAGAGAHVTHVDASKKAVRWAQFNQRLSGLAERPIRWLVDDAYKFVRREIRRGSIYDGLILDPPVFGRGPKGHMWELNESLTDLLIDCRKLLSDKPIFVVLTAYALRASALNINYALQEMLIDLGGSIRTGELALMESSAGRALSMALYARWSRAV